MIPLFSHERISYVATPLFTSDINYVTRDFRMSIFISLKCKDLTGIPGAFRTFLTYNESRGFKCVNGREIVIDGRT